MEPKIRRNFAFQRLYFELVSHLNEDRQKVRLFEAICLYGFEQQEPNFEDDPLLLNLWTVARAELDFSWAQSQQGQNGGLKSGRRKSKTAAAKKEATPHEQPPVQTEPFPEDAAPAKEFISLMKYNSLDLLVCAEVPLSGPQFRWLYNHAGVRLTTDLVRNMNNYLKKNGGLEYLSQPDMKERSIGRMILTLYQDAEAAFNTWLNETFPKVARMAQTLTLAQYQSIRYSYGRANVLVKLHQLNSKKTIYRNVRAEEILKGWIDKSVTATAGSKFWLKYYDDNVENAHLDSCPVGYDKDFDLGGNWTGIYMTDGTPI